MSDYTVTYYNNDNEVDTIATEEETSISTYEDKYANIFLRGPICKKTINPIIEFIFESNFNKKIDIINLFIHTDGGDYHEGLKLVDTIKMSEIPVRTIGWGKVFSTGLMILMAGKERLVSKNCTILSHNPTYNVSNFSVKINDSSHQQEFDLILKQMYSLYIEYTKKDKKYIKKYLLKETDVYLSADDAIKHGLVDGFIKDGMSWLTTIE